MILMININKVCLLLGENNLLIIIKVKYKVVLMLCMIKLK